MAKDDAKRFISEGLLGGAYLKTINNVFSLYKAYCENKGDVNIVIGLLDNIAEAEKQELAMLGFAKAEDVDIDIQSETKKILHAAQERNGIEIDLSKVYNEVSMALKDFLKKEDVIVKWESGVICSLSMDDKGSELFPYYEYNVRISFDNGKRFMNLATVPCWEHNTIPTKVFCHLNAWNDIHFEVISEHKQTSPYHKNPLDDEWDDDDDDDYPYNTKDGEDYLN